MFLETERLILRKLREEDFPDFCAYATDPEMCRMMGNDPMDTEEAAWETFDWILKNEPRCYCLVCKEDGRGIGNLTVTPVDVSLASLPALAGKQGRSMSFGLSRQYRRRGLMSEAVEAVADRLFREEGMDYIHLITMPIEFKGAEVISVENVLWKK